MRTASPRKPHSHDDAPETARAFERLAGLPDGPERRRLRDELVTAWLPMAERIAVRFRGRGEALEDLYQVAALGLVKAVDHYDPARGNAFEAYAVPTVTGEIKRHFRDHMWTLHVPRRVQDLRNRVRTAAKELAQTAPGRAPTVAEIAAHTRLTEDEVRTGMEALECVADGPAARVRFGDGVAVEEHADRVRVGTGPVVVAHLPRVRRQPHQVGQRLVHVPRGLAPEEPAPAQTTGWSRRRAISRRVKSTSPRWSSPSFQSIQLTSLSWQ
ncbi:RNA polymerase sigma factor RpoD [Streptomyces griseoloalbus]